MTPLVFCLHSLTEASRLAVELQRRFDNLGR